MLRPTLLLLLVAVSCHAAPDSTAINQLYQSVVVGDYDTAVSQAKEYKYRTNVISEVVNKLIDNSQRNVVDFGIALWNNNAQEIVKNNFPLEIRSIVGQHLVKLIGKRDNMVVKLDVNVDGDGDRIAFGDPNHMIGDRMAWKLIPVLGSQVHFKIYNPLTNQYLKLGSSTDGDGDHKVYGSSKSGDHIHHWFLVPVKYEGEILFYIFNRQYQQALKLSRAVDSYGDRQLFSENGNVLGSPRDFGWIIKPL